VPLTSPVPSEAFKFNVGLAVFVKPTHDLNEDTNFHSDWKSKDRDAKGVATAVEAPRTGRKLFHRKVIRLGFTPKV
jgi:hypothetical protein